jgi:hypothetical protein
MQKLQAELGFNPKRSSGGPIEEAIGDDCMSTVDPKVPPPCREATGGRGSTSDAGCGSPQRNPWRSPANPAPWLDALRSKIVGRRVDPAQMDERREYVLKDIKLSEAVEALRKPLAKYGLEDANHRSVAFLDSGGEYAKVCFTPYKWNPDAAAIGLVAVQAWRNAGDAPVTITEVYGPPFKMKPAPLRRM